MKDKKANPNLKVDIEVELCNQHSDWHKRDGRIYLLSSGGEGNHISNFFGGWLAPSSACLAREICILSKWDWNGIRFPDFWKPSLNIVNKESHIIIIIIITIILPLSGVSQNGRVVLSMGRCWEGGSNLSSSHLEGEICWSHQKNQNSYEDTEGLLLVAFFSTTTNEWEKPWFCTHE